MRSCYQTYPETQRVKNFETQRVISLISLYQ
jgi:hypothetical protein